MFKRSSVLVFFFVWGLGLMFGAVGLRDLRNSITLA
jgi:hypothetical protein